MKMESWRKWISAGMITFQLHSRDYFSITSSTANKTSSLYYVPEGTEENLGLVVRHNLSKDQAWTWRKVANVLYYRTGQPKDSLKSFPKHLQHQIWRKVGSLVSVGLTFEILHSLWKGDIRNHGVHVCVVYCLLLHSWDVGNYALPKA